MPKLLVATTNQGKQKEIAQILAGLDFEMVFPQDVASVADLEIDETGETFAENALLKAQAYAERSGLLTVADDSGLIVNALDNFPGVRSGRWLKGTGADRAQGILNKLEAHADRSALFVTVACLYNPELTEAEYFEDKLVGTIANELKLGEGFEYDYIFIPEGYSETLSALGVTAKNKFSHRALAFQKVRAFLVTTE